MENIDEINRILDLEEKLNFSIDMLEIAKCYCENNYDKAIELTALGSILDVILKNQKSLTNTLDELIIV